MKARLAATLAAALLAVAIAAPQAQAAFGLNGFDVSFGDEKGEAQLEAGSHPYEMTVSFGVNNSGGFVDGQPRDVFVAQMPGFVGNPTAVPQCATVDFLTPTTNAAQQRVPACPNSAAVGLVKNTVGNSAGGAGASAVSAVFNLEPPPGVAAKLGFWVLGVPVSIELGVNESPPYNVIGGPSNISEVLEVLASKFTLWGVPVDPSHDSLRGLCVNGDGSSLGKCPANISAKPFLTLPRACRGPLASSYEATSWQGGFDHGEALTHEDAGNPRGMVGCGKLDFGPSVSAQPTSHSAESPSGLDLEIKVNDEGLTNPSGRAASDIEKAVITLPEGMTLNPSQAEGLGVCTEADLAREKLATPFGSGCPGSSKIGTVEAESPLLENRVLRGSIFVAKPFANPFGTLIAIYIVLREPERGLIVKLPSRVEPDLKTGQIVSVTEDVPQLPVSRFRVHFREGGRSPLITPARCGEYETKTLFTPYADPASTYETGSSFTVDSGVGGGPCPQGPGQPFSPGFEAGAQNNAAAAHSPFLMRIVRPDGDQDLTRFDATLPPGVTASLAGVSQCSDAAIAAAKAKSGVQEKASPSCPPSSKIGDVLGGAGVGQELTYVPGSLYLAGPVGGAPLSVVAIVPAVAGPFDVGTVVTREALRIDPVSGQAKVDGAVSDPIPHILAGIPLRVREIRVDVNRPDFTLNPTSCDRFSVNASLWGGGQNVFSSLDDSPVSRLAPFQAADCSSLGFSPSLSLRLRGGVRRGAFPALHLVYAPRPGDANLSHLVLRFPRSEFIEQGHFRTICTRVQFAAGAGHGEGCPKGAVYGHAQVFTPLLDEPVEGPVFLRSSEHNLPDVVLALHGPPSVAIQVEVSARIDSVHGGLRATVAETPDLPVTKAIVDMQGGQKGLFVNSRNLCASESRARADLLAHNAKQAQLRPVMRPSGCRHKRGKRQQSNKR